MPESEGLDEPKAMRLLVVDDIASNLKLLGRLLKNRGQNYDEAEDGLVAVKKS